MSTSTPPARLAALAVAIVAALALAASACSSGDGSNATTTAPSDTATDTAAADAYPVTIEHRYGTTTIEEEPQRIVSLDTAWTDVLLDMDQEPTGYLADYNIPEGFPWRGDRLDGSTEMKATTELPWEQIAALQPDLIVVGYFAQDQADYDKLTAIAPTIASLTDAQVDPWQDVTTTAGKVLGDPEKAQQVIDDVDHGVEAIAQELPGLKGRTFSFANYVAGDAIYVLSDPDDGANVLFTQLGMEIPPDIAADASEGRVKLSLEQVGMLDGDLLLALLNGTDPSSIPGWDQLPAVRSGAAVEMDYALATALNTPTPLSIPWALGQIRPQLEIAAG